MATRHLETDTLSNQNISSALAIGAYTADADRWIAAQAFADQVAGNGDYYLYLTLQINGAGSSYKSGITTLTAASGVTSIFGQTVYIFVRSGDVVTCYLDGLAGDTTTPDTIVRWAELDALRPTTVDRTVNITAGGLVDDPAGVTTLLSRLSAARAGYLDYLAGWTATIFAEIGAKVWAYATRTLTMTAAQAAASVSGSDLIVTNYVDYSSGDVSVGSISASWTAAYLTVKRHLSDADADSILQIKVSNPAAGSTDGVLYVDGAAASASQRTQGSLTVTQASGTIAIALTDDLTAVLPAGNYTYDVKILTATASAKPVGSANFVVQETETQSI